MHYIHLQKLSNLGPFVYLLPNLLKLFGFPTFRLCTYLMEVMSETRSTY